MILTLPGKWLEESPFAWQSAHVDSIGMDERQVFLAEENIFLEIS